MNALEMNVDQLAEYLDELFDADGEPKAAAAMLRKQHEAIVKLREALISSSNYVDTLGSVSSRYRQVLASTEDLK